MCGPRSPWHRHGSWRSAAIPSGECRQRRRDGRTTRCRNGREPSAAVTDEGELKAGSPRARDMSRSATFRAGLLAGPNRRDPGPAAAERTHRQPHRNAPCDRCSPPGTPYAHTTSTCPSRHGATGATGPGARPRDTAGGIRTHTSRRTEAFEASCLPFHHRRGGGQVYVPSRIRPMSSSMSAGAAAASPAGPSSRGGQLADDQAGAGGDQSARGVVPGLDARS